MMGDLGLAMHSVATAAENITNAIVWTTKEGTVFEQCHHTVTDRCGVDSSIC